MANLITHSLSYSKENEKEYFFKPIFVQSDIRDIVTVRTDIKSGDKINFVSTLEKIVKAYAQGSSFTSSTGVTITQKEITTSKMKAEVQENGHAFYNMVMQSNLMSGAQANDISGTIFEQIIMELFNRAIQRDIQRQIFFNASQRETRSSDVPTGTASVDYNVYDGLWDKFFQDVASVTIAASQVVDVNVTAYQNSVAVAEVATATATGTSGTANITVNGVAYLLTFTTNLTTSCANFVTSHAATIAARESGILVTSSGATVIFTSSIAGDPHTVSAPVNVSGDLAGSVAATTANVQNTTLKTDAALSIFKLMYAAAQPELKEFKSEMQILCTESMFLNYQATLESLNGSELAYRKLENGIEYLYFRGVKVIPMVSWDTIIENDLGGVRPHRAVMTIPKNLIVGVDGSGDDSNIEFFYDKPTQNNYFRSEFRMGIQYYHEKYLVLAY